MRKIQGKQILPLAPPLKAHHSGVPTPRGCHSQGAYTNIRCGSAGVYTGDAIRLKYIYSQCCSAEIYTCDAVLLQYIIMCDAVLLEYIRAMLGLATPGSGDPKPFLTGLPQQMSLLTRRDLKIEGFVQLPQKRSGKR